MHWWMSEVEVVEEVITALKSRISEKVFMQMVVELALLLGYLAYHTYDSRRCVAGFPDLVLVQPARTGRAGRIIFVELKVARNTTTAEQDTWLAALQSTQDITGIEVYIWRPEQWDRIVAILKRDQKSPAVA